MQKKENNDTLPMQRINTSIEKLISKNGLEKTADFLETISLSNSLQFSEVNVNLQKFIFAETVKQFQVSPRLFDSPKVMNALYKSARATCFYLYHTHANLSDRNILHKHKKYPWTRSKVNYAIRMIVELIEIPAIDKSHFEKHQKVEEKVKNFIASSKK